MNPGHPIELDAFLGKYPLAGAHDEMRAPSGELRTQYRALADTLVRLPSLDRKLPIPEDWSVLVSARRNRPGVGRTLRRQAANATAAIDGPVVLVPHFSFPDESPMRISSRSRSGNVHWPEGAR